MTKINKSDPQQELRMRTRRAFLTGGITALIGVSSWEWINDQEEDQGIPWPLRRVLQWNEALWKNFFSPQRLALLKNPPQDGKQVILNGDLGLTLQVDVSDWRLEVVRRPDSLISLITLQEIRSLPRTVSSAEFKCIEGWSDKNKYSGVRFSDFLSHYRLGTRSGQSIDLKSRPHDLYPFVGFETPDKNYYVSIDMQSMMHPQTLLCYEMNGTAISSEHGAPLRLYIPVKYGIKSLKRVGRIWFSEERPPDYWAERGYDWYSGL